MPAFLVLALALTAQPKTEPDRTPLVLQHTMEIDDIDRDLQRFHDTVLLKRGMFANSQRLAQREGVARSQLDRERASLRYEEAREAETIAYRELKAYERDVLARDTPFDETKYYSLLLDWLKKQEAKARVDLEHCDSLVRQTRNLYQRKAASRQELEDSEINVNRAQASVALSRSRQAQVNLEIASHRAEKPNDQAGYDRLKGDYLEARVQYYEIILAGCRSRRAIAADRSRRGLIPQGELLLFQKAVDSAEAALDAERKKLEKLESKPAADAPKAR